MPKLNTNSGLIDELDGSTNPVQDLENYKRHIEENDEGSLTQRLADSFPFLDNLEDFIHLLRGGIGDHPDAGLTIAGLGLLAPLALLGAVASGVEMREAYGEIKEAMKEQDHLADRILAIARSCDDKYRGSIERIAKRKIGAVEKSLTQKIKAKFSYKSKSSNARIFENKLQNSYNLAQLENDIAANRGDNIELVECLNKYQAAQNERVMAELSMVMGGLEGAALLGFVGAVTPAFMAAIDTIREGSGGGAAHFESLESLEATVEGAELIASSFFLAGQILMTAYAGFKWHHGNKKIAEIKEDREILNHGFVKINAKNSRHFGEIFDRQQRLIELHSKRYGQAMSIGQIFSGAGVACGLSGVAAVAAVPLLSVGTALSAPAATLRIINSGKERRFLGHASTSLFVTKASKSLYVKNIVERNEPFSMLLKDVNDGGNEADSFQKVADKTVQSFEKSVDALAATKLMSLIHKLVNNKRHRGGYVMRKSVQERVDIFEKRLLRLQDRSDSVKGTGLESSVSRKIKELYFGNKTAIRILLRLKNHDANARISDCSLNILHKFQAGQDFSFSDSLLGKQKITESQASEIIGAIGLNQENINKKGEKGFSGDVVRMAKFCCKSLRVNFMENAVVTAKAAQQYLELKNEKALPVAVVESPKASRIDGTLPSLKRQGSFVDNFAPKRRSDDFGVDCSYQKDGNGNWVFDILDVGDGSLAQKIGLGQGDKIIVEGDYDFEEARFKAKNIDDDASFIKDGEKLDNGDIRQIRDSERNSLCL